MIDTVQTLFKRLRLVITMTLLMAPTASSASDLRLEIDVIESYQIQENFLRRDDLVLRDQWHFTQDLSYNLLNLRPTVVLNPAKSVWGYVGIDMTWQSSVADEDDDEVQVDFSTAYLSLKGHQVSMDVGIQPVEFGGAYIFVDDALAMAVHARLGKGYAELVAAQAMDSSPIVGVTLGYRPGYFERVEVFGIWYDDRDDTFAESLPSTNTVINADQSKGSLYYMGVATDLFLGNAMLSLVAAYQMGEYTIGDAATGTQADVRAYFADISLQKNVTDWCTVGIFCHIASGDEELIEGDLNSFVALMPYNARASIFFDPDFMDVDDAEQFVLSGGHIGGAFAPGVNITLASDRGLTAEIALIYLLAGQALDDGSQWYGWEADLDISYALNERYKLFLEAARFEHGNYYESLLDESLDAALRFSVGLRAIF